MKKFAGLLVLMLLTCIPVMSQTPNQSQSVIGPVPCCAFLPAQTTTQQNALVMPAGTFVYNSTLSRFSFYNGTAWIQPFPIAGTTAAGNASAGEIGEVISGTDAPGATSLTTATAANAGPSSQVSLTAGDWDCTGAINFTPTATTSITILQAGIGTTTATLPAQDSFYSLSIAANVPGTTTVLTFPVPVVRINVSATTTAFLVAKATFTASTLTAGGTTRCRRVR